MTVVTAHRILIGAAVVFFLFLAARDLLGSRGGEDWESLLRGGGALLAAVGFAIYWRRIPRR
jgi:hypothetical protein